MFAWIFSVAAGVGAAALFEQLGQRVWRWYRETRGEAAAGEAAAAVRGTPKVDYTAKAAADNYQTSPEHVVMHPAGVSEVLGRDITILPLVDSRFGFYASMTYADAKTWAEERGGRLISADEIEEIGRMGDAIKAEPCELVYDDKTALRMRTLEYAAREAKCINEQLERGGLPRGKPVLNAGKWWIHGAPAGRAWLMGWRQKGGNFIQPRPPANAQGKHNDKHYDYGTLTMVSFPKGGAP